MTDAYLLLGVLDGNSYFGGALKLDSSRAQAAITENIAKPLGVSLDAALARMEKAYVAKIAAAMRPLVSGAGTALLAFGGAGPMSACKVADELGITEIIVPRMAAVFSAFGIGFSDIAHTYNAALATPDAAAVQELLQTLTQRARRDMYAEGFEMSDCAVESSIAFTRDGTSATHPLNGSQKLPRDLAKAEDLRVQLRATKGIPHFTLGRADTKPAVAAATTLTRALRLQQSGSQQLSQHTVPLFRHEDLRSGEWAMGPAIVEEEYFTCVVPAGWRFLVNDNRDLVLNKKTSGVAS